MKMDKFREPGRLDRRDFDRGPPRDRSIRYSDRSRIPQEPDAACRDYSDDSRSLASRIYIGNVDTKNLRFRDIAVWLDRHGRIADWKLFDNHVLVQFEREEDARRAAERENGVNFHGSKVDVRMAESGDGLLGEGKGSKPVRRSRSPARQRPIGGRDGRVASPERNRSQPRMEYENGRTGYPREMALLSAAPSRRVDDRSAERGGRSQSRGGKLETRDDVDVKSGFRGYGTSRSGLLSRENDSPSSRYSALDRGNDRFPKQGLLDHDRNERPNKFEGSESSGGFGARIRDEPALKRRLNESPTRDFGRGSELFPSELSTGASAPAVKRERPPYDAAIIVMSSDLLSYAAMVEGHLQKRVGLTTHILVLREEAHVSPCLEEQTSKNVLYGVIINSVNEQHSSLNVKVLYDTRQPKDHRNMPLNDAISMIGDDFEAYTSQAQRQLEKQGPPPLPKDRNTNRCPAGFIAPSDKILHLLNLLADFRMLTLEELNDLMSFLSQRKSELLRASGMADQVVEVPRNKELEQPHRSLLPTAHGSRDEKAILAQQAELHTKILSILNPGQTGSKSEGMQQPFADGSHSLTSDNQLFSGYTGYNTSENAQQSNPNYPVEQGRMQMPQNREALNSHTNTGASINLENPQIARAIDNLMASSEVRNITGGMTSTHHPSRQLDLDYGKATANYNLSSRAAGAEATTYDNSGYGDANYGGGFEMFSKMSDNYRQPGMAMGALGAPKAPLQTSFAGSATGSLASTRFRSAASMQRPRQSFEGY